MMTSSEKIAFKSGLKRFALDLIGQRITTAREAIDQAQQAANQEEKSSAGDKYETSRAMGHLQKDMHARQLGENLKELSTLHGVVVETVCSEVMTGAYVRAAGAAGESGFFIAAGLGKQTIGEETIIFLSPQAPLARLLLNKKTGESFTFNGAVLTITEVF